MSADKPNARTRIQRSTFTEVKRSQINPAIYNPRAIEDYARNLLKKSLKEFGVSGLVWNKRTGNLISGHQRLSILDEAHKFPVNDYTVGVELVDIDLKKEKQLNVWLNNKSAQGSFERDAFFDVMRTGIQLEDVGLTVTDLRDEFGDLPPDLFANPDIGKPATSPPQASAPVPEVTRVAPQTAPPDTPAPAQKQTKPVAMDPDDFVLVCFASGDEKSAWLKSKHMPEGTKTMAIEDIMQVELGK